MHRPPEGASASAAAGALPFEAEPGAGQVPLPIDIARETHSRDDGVRTTAREELDRAALELADHARAFARTDPREKAAMLRATIPRWLAVTEGLVALGCEAKRLIGEPGAGALPTVSGEEWLAGAYPVAQNLRLLADALEDIAKEGRPSLSRTGRPRERADGRIVAPLAPRGAEAMLTSGLRSYVLFEPGVIASDVPAFQAPAYQKLEPVGGVSLVLGGGNVASIPAMDALHKLFVDGHVVLLKMSPVNAYLGPLVERAFGPFVEAGFLRVVYGGADVGAYLCSHPALTDVHVTGSEATHDRIVWGPPGPERDERKRAGRPVFNNRLTSELGNVSPVVVVPFLYAHDELWFQARSVASQVINNASFNCNAAKIVVVSSKWPQRDLFLEMVAQALAAAPTRFAYYPGAHDRYGRLVQGRARVVCIGEAPPGTLPWTLVPDLDPRDAAEPLFRTESFCALFGEVSLPAGDPAHFVADAVRFCNERLWGTLNAAMIVPPVLEEDPVFGVVIERAIAELRYGTVAINTWPAVAYASAIAPWGGHASSTLADVQSGIGFVHNTLMLERIDKTVVRAPLRMFPKPPFFSENRRMDAVGRRLTEFAARPTWAGALSVARTALRG